MRKGIVFTYDALLALSLLGSFLVVVVVYYYNTSSYESYVMIKEKKNNYLAKDIITTLNLMKYEDLPQELQELLALKINMSKDFLEGKTLSEILVLLWVKNQTSYVDDLISNVYYSIGEITNLNISINDDIIFSTENTSSNIMYVAYTYITGYEENKQPLGYVSKAFATKIKKNTTLIFPISPEGAGNRGGWLTITKKFYFNSSPDNITDAIFYISIHQGTDSADFEQLRINGNNIKNDVVWIWEEVVSTGKGAFGYVDIKPYIQEGWNELLMRFRNPWFNAHIHPGSRIEITYQDDDFYRSDKNKIEYIYYENVRSDEQANRNTGAWATMEYYVPLNSTLNNATLHLVINDVEDAGWWFSWDDWRWYNWDVRVYVNGILIDEIENPPTTINKYYDLTPYTKEGTNYIVVYANTYGNVFTGVDYTEIYSDPQNDPYGSTYVFLNYTLDKSRLYYGKIDVNVNEFLGGNRENPKSYDVIFDNYPLLKTLLHVAQLFSYTITVDVDNGNTVQQVFESLFPRGIPSSIYIDPIYFNVNNVNTITMTDSCSGCDYLPESSFEYTLLIPSHVGYGDVFPTKEQATEDAIQRLIRVLGKYINATEIKNETVSIGNIPYLYGPVTLKVVVW